MLINTFTIWACNDHLRTISENYLFKNHRTQFLWPEKLKAHRQWIDKKEAHIGMKRSYLSVKTEQDFKQLKNLGALVAYIDATYKAAGNSDDFNIIVTGVNSIRACAMAIEFVANQLAAEDIPYQSSLVLLPSAKRH